MSWVWPLAPQPAVNGLLDATDRLARLLAPALIASVAAWLPVEHFLSLDRHRLLGFLLLTCPIGKRSVVRCLVSGRAAAAGARWRQAVDAFEAVIACYGSPNLAGNLIIGSRTGINRLDRLILWGNVINGAGIALIGLCALVPGVAFLRQVTLIRHVAVTTATNRAPSPSSQVPLGSSRSGPALAQRLRHRGRHDLR